MRPWPALALLLVLLPGCSSGGCWPEGGYVSWKQPGIHQDLSEVEAVSVQAHEETRGVPVDAPGAAAFLGAEPRLLQVRHGEVEFVRITWQGDRVELAGYVAERGPGPSAVRSAAQELLAALVDPDTARDWLDDNLPPLARERDFALAVDLPLRPGPVLDDAAGPWRVGVGEAEVEGGNLLWRLLVDRTAFHVPDQPQVDVIGTDRVVVYVPENPADLDEAVALGFEVLEAYGVGARPDLATATWLTQYVCT